MAFDHWVPDLLTWGALENFDEHEDREEDCIESKQSDEAVPAALFRMSIWDEDVHQLKQNGDFCKQDCWHVYRLLDV